MKYPSLVPPAVCRTDITLEIDSEDLDEDGAPVQAFAGTLKCNWQDGGKMELTGQQKFIRITGTAYFNGDICPSVSNITSGYGTVFGQRRPIAEGRKARNPDGTVNYTEVKFR